MIQLLIKRIGAMILSLLVIVIIGFGLMESLPGDPVLRILGRSQQQVISSAEFNLAKYDQLYYELGYHLPKFYFTWTSLAVPDSFYRVPQLERRAQLIALSSSTGNPRKVYQFRKSEERFKDAINNSVEINNVIKISLREFANRLLQCKTTDEINSIFKTNTDINEITDHLVTNEFQNLISISRSFNNETSSYKKWIPVISFHKINKFHLWFFGNINEFSTYNDFNNKGIIHGDLGLSTVSHRSVSSILFKSFSITFILSFLAILVSVFFSIPIAVKFAIYRNRFIVKLTPGILLFINTIPLFFIGTLLLMLFANANVFNFFPSSGIAPAGGFDENLSGLQIVYYSLPYLILPMVAYTLGSLTFFIRLIQSSLEEQLTTDYIRTARAKGVEERKVIGYHALRNSLLPLITIATTAFPAMISGSILLENIFSIPGMGTEIVRALQNQDYPVMIGFFLLMGFVTIIIYMFADLLYSIIDPRFFNQNKIKVNG